MPYPAEHKLKTHARIVDMASRLFRRDGYAGTGVDTLMNAAGLTRGGFYAHFRDKAALLSEALDRAFDESYENLLEGKLEAVTGTEWLRAASRRYLSSSHRQSPDLGCAIPALGAEVSRAPARVRRRFASQVKRMIDGMSERLGGGARGRREATALLASWVGAILLARAVGDSALADEISASVREHWDERAR